AEALAEVGRLLSQTLDPVVVARRITEHVCRLLDARSAAVYRPERDSGLLIADTVFETDRPFIWQTRLDRGTGVAGLALTSRAARCGTPRATRCSSATAPAPGSPIMPMCGSSGASVTAGWHGRPNGRCAPTTAAPTRALSVATPISWPPRAPSPRSRFRF